MHVWSLAKFEGGRNIRPDLKYLAHFQGDAHLAFFWSLAIFRHGRIIRPSFEISGQNIQQASRVMRTLPTSGP
jgi:hypothetical protein